MASIIRIKRSLGNLKPNSLYWGELGYVTGIGSHSGEYQYKDRIFLGDNNNNVYPVGGHYYTSMMDHTPGVISSVSNSRNYDGGIVAILDSERKVDQWNVDNLRLDGNTLSSTNNNGNIILNASGTGKVVVPDNKYLNFGDDNDVIMYYDENIDDRFEIQGANWYFYDGVSISINDTTNSTSKDSGALVVEGGVGIERDLFVGSNITVSNTSTFGNIKIKNNVLSTSEGTNEIYIDPYVDGLSDEGTVIVKGNLQVDGTTISVNSTILDINDPIIILGDVTSQKTVMTTVVTGVSTIRLDSVVGLNTNDLVTGSSSLSLSGVGTITSVDSFNKIITLLQPVISGISTTTQLTITSAYDTNTDRGIGFKYNTSSGILNNKTGFFGYIDSTNIGSAATSRSWTYIPDATITNSSVTGIRGYLDIKGIYYQTGDFNTHGVVYFDTDGLQTSTNNPSAPTITSKQILTSITKVNLTLPNSISVSVGDLIRQDISNAYGIVEVGGNISTVSLVGVEGTFNTTNNLRKENSNGQIENLSVIPSSADVIYTNRPTWTSTLDGGYY